MNRHILKILAGVTTVAATTGVAVPALAGGSTHTMKFTAIEIRNQPFKGDDDSTVDKDVANGKVVAYNELDLVGNEAQVAIALKGGFLYGHFTVGKTGAFHGPVTGGTGPYKSASGTIDGQLQSAKKA